MAAPALDDAARSALTRSRFVHLGFAVGLLALISTAYRARDDVPLVEIPDAALWALRIALGVLALGALSIPPLIARNLRAADGAGWMRRFAPEVRRAWAVSLIRAGFAEAIGMYGFVLYVSGGELADLIVFVGVSFAALAGTFPTHARWSRLVASAPG